MEKITFCISTHNNLNYLILAIESVRKNSFFKTAPFIVHAENCTDGTNEWLLENKENYRLELYIENNNIPIGIGGGMNFCAEKVKTEYIMFLHSDFYVSENWDLYCLEEIEKYPEDRVWIFSHRLEPNIFNSSERQGTIFFNIEEFGSMYFNFNKEKFESYAKDFSKLNENYRINKSEGVSGLIRKKDWDYIGGNDSLFAPTSYDDTDLFLRMSIEEYKFILLGKSVVWHFGARGSHRLEENNNMSSKRQIETEKNNIKKWMLKWSKEPISVDFNTIIPNFYKDRYYYLKNLNLHKTSTVSNLLTIK